MIRSDGCMEDWDYVLISCQTIKCYTSIGWYIHINITKFTFAAFPFSIWKETRCENWLSNSVKFKTNSEKL